MGSPNFHDYVELDSDVKLRLKGAGLIVGVASGVAVPLNETVTILGTKTVASATGAAWNAVNFQASTLTLTGSTTITEIAAVRFQRPTITLGTAAVTTAATVIIDGPPTSGGTVASLYVKDGQVKLKNTTDTPALFIDSSINRAITVLTGGSSSVSAVYITTNPNTIRALEVAHGGGSSGTGTVLDLSYSSPATGGSYSILNVTGAAHTNQAANSEINFVSFNLSQTVQWATGALTTQRAVLFQAPTYAFVGASTITNAATVAINGAPAAGANATITTPLAFWVQAGNSLFSGNARLDTTTAGVGTQAFFVRSTNVNTRVVEVVTPAWSSGTANAGLAVEPAGFPTGGTNYGILVGTGGGSVATSIGMSIQMLQASSGIQRYLEIVGVGSTNQTLSTEINFVNFNLAQTVQWATGALTTQRCFLVRAPTLAFVGASTVTDAATVAITGAPATGTNATITNPMAFWVQAGTTRLDTALVMNGAPTSPIGSRTVELTQPAATSGTPNGLTFAGGAHTTLAAGGEAFDWNIALNRTVQWSTGAIALQRAVFVQAPTYAFVGASTITTAATMAISGAPVAGTNATITQGCALLVQSGNVGLFSATPTFGSGTSVLYVGNASANPSVNPTAGGILYANAGAGTWRGSGGTVTAFGPAGPHCGECGSDMWAVAAINSVWRSWCYECGVCGHAYRGGPRDVRNLLSDGQKNEMLRDDMTWDEVSAIVGAA